MKILYFLIATVFLTLVSCGDTEKSKEQNKKEFIQSYELGGPNFRDTINLVDGNGYKQGLWIMPISKDTMIYKNDTGYSASGHTYGEVVRMLQSGNKGLFVSYDSLAIKSH